MLTRFVNRGYRDRADLRAVLPGGSRVRLSIAGELADRYARLAEQKEPASASASIDIPPYDGANSYVRRMVEELRRTVAQDLVGAYVHGSLGSGEAVAYSDFDALAILSDETMSSPARLCRAAKALRKAQRIMKAHDPLQHHGWFVLTEADLRSYCEAYFPVVLFEHSRVLVGASELHLAMRDSADEMREALSLLTASVLKRLSGRPPRNTYELKGLLSQFMLLPALYVQVRDGRGVWKADSFAMAAPDFTREDWAAMEHVSAIRRDWAVEFPGWRRRVLATQSPFAAALRKSAAPPIPASIANRLDGRLYAAMIRLTQRMQNVLETRPVEVAL